jgi:hypothetical protein
MWGRDSAYEGASASPPSIPNTSAPTGANEEISKKGGMWVDGEDVSDLYPSNWRSQAHHF